MKTEINLENKAKFFALFWGQEILYLNDNKAIIVNGSNINKISITDVTSQLGLKPLSSITDGDLDVISCMWINPLAYHYIRPTDRLALVKEKLKTALFTGVWTIEVYQYLQSEGYALPWMGLLVNEMVEAGWVKLT